MSGKWAVGERVLHRKFGIGTIIAINESPNGPVGRIAFDAGRERRIVLDRQYLRDAGESLAAVAAAIIEPVPTDDDHGHGKHWGIFFDEPIDALKRLPRFFNKAKLLSVRRLTGPAGMLVLCEDYRRDGMVVIVETGETENRIVTVYPAVEDGVVHSLRVTQVTPWASGAEAHVTALWRNEVSITFFDTRYALDGERYATQPEGQFAIAAFAYRWSVAGDEKMTLPPVFKSEAARDQFLQQHPDAREWLANGHQPMAASLAGAAMMIPSRRDDTDWSVRGVVEWIDTIEMLDQPVYRIRLAVARSLDDHAPFDITLFAPARTLEGAPPIAGDDLEAVIWLTGYRMDG